MTLSRATYCVLAILVPFHSLPIASSWFRLSPDLFQFLFFVAKTRLSLDEIDI